MIPGQTPPLLFGSARPPRATLVFTAKEHASTTTLSGGTVATTGSLSFAAKTWAFIAVVRSSNITAPPTVASSGRTWTIVHAQAYPADPTRRMDVFKSYAATATSGALTITFATSMNSAAWSVVEVAGADPNTNTINPQIWAVRTGTTATSLAASFRYSLEDATNGMLVFTALNTTATVTPDGSFSELGDDSESADAITIQSQYAIGETSCTSTFASASAASVALEIRSAHGPKLHTMKPSRIPLGGRADSTDGLNMSWTMGVCTPGQVYIVDVTVSHGANPIGTIGLNGGNITWTQIASATVRSAAGENRSMYRFVGTSASAEWAVMQITSTETCTGWLIGMMGIYHCPTGNNGQDAIVATNDVDTDGSGHTTYSISVPNNGAPDLSRDDSIVIAGFGYDTASTPTADSPLQFSTNNNHATPNTGQSHGGAIFVPTVSFSIASSEIAGILSEVRGLDL